MIVGQSAADLAFALGRLAWLRARQGRVGECRDDAGEARDALTPQQTQIALLLASGQTTRGAAAALFLGPKTVEHHLRGVYRTVGISSRRELAEAAASLTALVPGARQQ